MRRCHYQAMDDFSARLTLLKDRRRVWGFKTPTPWWEAILTFLTKIPSYFIWKK